jgi:hypothetical protein
MVADEIAKRLKKEKFDVSVVHRDMQK